MNRCVYPASLFPLRGDVSAEAGATSVTVIGLQRTPISPIEPNSGQSLVAIPGPAIGGVPTVVWTPTTINGCVYCNGIPVSGDYAFFCRGVDLAFLTDWPYGFDFFVFQNGVGVPGTETSR